MEQESPLVARLVLSVIAIMVLAIPFGINLKESLDVGVLRRSSRSVQATVTSKTCQNHSRLSYSYTVDGRKYSGMDTFDKAVCETAEIGDEIPIIYAAEKPGFSKSRPVDFYEGTVGGNFFALFLLSLCAIVIIFRVTRIDVDGPESVEHRSFRLTRKKS